MAKKIFGWLLVALGGILCLAGLDGFVKGADVANSGAALVLGLVAIAGALKLLRPAAPAARR